MRCELRKDSFPHLQSGLPVEVNQMLHRGEVPLAPCSSVCLLTSPGNEIAMPIGVTTRGAADSVYWGLSDENAVWDQVVEERILVLRGLFSDVRARHGSDARFMGPELWKKVRELPPIQMPRPRLVLTPASAASAMLSKILYEMIFGYELDDLPREKPGRQLELLIGDEAMRKKPQFRSVLDLGELWFRITQLPFVFAVWQSRGVVQHSWKQRIFEAAEKAEARMTIEPAYYYPDMMPLDQTYQPLDLARYWKKIRYRLGAEELQGLMLYLCLVRSRFANLSTDATAIKLMKWQELSTRVAQKHHLNASSLN